MTDASDFGLSLPSSGVKTNAAALGLVMPGDESHAPPPSKVTGGTAAPPRSGFIPEAIEAAGEGAKTLWQSLVMPGRAGAQAGGQIAGSVLEGSGAAAGSLAELPIVGGARAAPAAPATRQLLGDFEKAGVTPNLPAVGHGRTAGLVSQIANTLPISGPQVRNALNRTVSDTATAAERTAAQHGTAQGPIEAGESLQRGVNQFVGDFKDKANTLYREFDAHMANAPPVALPNTLRTLSEPISRFPSAPQLGQQITNPKLRSFGEAVAPRERTIPEVLSAIVDANGQPIVARAAQKVTSGGALSFPELQEFRSAIGRMIGDPVLLSDIPRADLKRVYAGISGDMAVAAKAQGPQAYRAFKRANDFYRAGLDRIDKIDDLLKGSPEQSFARINRAAQTGSTANVGFLDSVKKSIGPQEWGNVGSAVIRRMGEPTAGAKDVLSGGAHFSVSSFSTNWNKLSDAAKEKLFGANMPGSPRAGLETLARVVQAQKNVGKLANVSRSGEYGLMGALAFMGIEHYAALAAHPLATLGGLGSVYGASKVLMSPGFARWLYSLPTLVEMAPTAEEGARRAAVNLTAAMHNPAQATQ